MDLPWRLTELQTRFWYLGTKRYCKFSIAGKTILQQSPQIESTREYRSQRALSLCSKRVGQQNLAAQPWEYTIGKHTIPKIKRCSTPAKEGIIKGSSSICRQISIMRGFQRSLLVALWYRQKSFSIIKLVIPYFRMMKTETGDLALTVAPLAFWFLKFLNPAIYLGKTSSH